MNMQSEEEDKATLMKTFRENWQQFDKLIQYSQEQIITSK